MRSCLLIGFLIVMNSPTNCELEFTSLDLDVIGKFREHFNSQCLVFVENREDVNSLTRMKYFGANTYFAVVNSSRLEKILEKNVMQLSFFQRRTTIVTKEDLNITSLVNSVYTPHYLTWVIFRDHTHLKGLYIPINTKVFFVQRAEGSVSVKQIYHFKGGIKETVKTLDWEHHFPDSINFQGITMDLLYLSPRGSCQHLNEKTLLRKLECIHWNLIELMGQKLNFSLNSVECKEKKYPFAFPNGSDSELFLKLKYKEVDFSALGQVITARGQRHYMDFVWPTFVLKSRMYLKQGKLTGRWASYLKPLDSSVWWGILLLIIVFGILLHLFQNLLLNELQLKISHVVELTISIMKALQVFCNQATPEMSEFYCIRIIYFLELFVVLIFFQAYCGYLVSSLTVVASRFPFLDLKGFFANDEYQVMTLNRGFHQFYFRKIVGKGQRENFMLPQEELPENIQEAVDKLCGKQRLAFTEFREDLLDFSKLNCIIAELPTPVLRLFVGIALPTTAPHKEYLRRELLTLRSSGIIRRFASKLSTQADFRDKKTANEFSSVAMSQVFSVFVLFIFGVLLSIIIFTFEVRSKSVKKQSGVYEQKLKKK